MKKIFFQMLHIHHWTIDWIYVSDRLVEVIEKNDYLNLKAYVWALPLDYVRLAYQRKVCVYLSVQRNLFSKNMNTTPILQLNLLRLTFRKFEISVTKSTQVKGQPMRIMQQAIQLKYSSNLSAEENAFSYLKNFSYFKKIY